MSLHEDLESVKRLENTLPSSLQYFRARTIDEPASWCIERQGRLLKVITEQQRSNLRPPRHQRGRVHEFSPQSRKRLIEKTQRIHPHRVERVLYITLTYPGKFPSLAEAKEHLQSWRKRFERWYGPAGGLWKMEIQLERRKKRGETVPHFHVLLWVPDGRQFSKRYVGRGSDRLGPGPQPESFRGHSHQHVYAVVRRMWAEVIEEYLSEEDVLRVQQDCSLTKTEVIRGDPKQVLSYVCKYIAKREETDEERVPIVRPSGVPSGGGGGVAAPVLDSITYLADDDGQTQAEEPSCGRWWGLWRKERLPWDEIQIEHLLFNLGAFLAFRELGHGLWDGIPQGARLCGWSLFTDHAEEAYRAGCSEFREFSALSNQEHITDMCAMTHI